MAVTSMEHRLSSIWSKSSPLHRLIKGDPSQPMARMIPLRGGKVQTGCAIYAAPAGCSSCFLSFYLTEYDVSDLIIVTSVVGHGPLCTLSRFSPFFVLPTSKHGKAGRRAGLPLRPFMKREERPENPRVKRNTVMRNNINLNRTKGNQPVCHFNAKARLRV